MTSVVIEGVEIDLERFMTELEVVHGLMARSSLLIPSVSGLRGFVKEIMEENENENRESNSEIGENYSRA